MLTVAIRTNRYVSARIDTFRYLIQTQEINLIPSGTCYYMGDSVQDVSTKEIRLK